MESPDHPDSPAEVANAECPGRSAGLEVGGSAGTVGAPVLEDGDVRDTLAAPVRDLTEAVREGKVAPEGDRDPLLDGDAAVRFDLCLDVGLDELVRLGEGRRCDCERDKRRSRDR